MRKTAAGVVEERVGGDASDYPAAVAISDAAGITRRVFVHGQDDHIWGASSRNDGPWTWESIAPAHMVDRFAGSPSASMQAGTVIVYARTTGGTVGTLRRGPSTGWTYANLGGAIANSPTSLSTGVLGHGRDGSLYYFDGTHWHSRGGRFD